MYHHYMRRFITGLGFALTLLLIGGGCASGNPTTDKAPALSKAELPSYFTDYKSTGGWSISYPNTWNLDETLAAEGQIYFKVPMADTNAGFQSNLGVILTPTEFTQDEVVLDELPESIKTALESAGTMEAKVSKIQFPFGEAIRAEGVLTQGTLTLRMTQVQAYRDYKGFVLTFMALPADYEAYKSDLDLTLQSFEPGL
ncbi:MAG: hypothetical protein HYY51_04290 [Candidatus Magasanikbacteria bacterium]|nr:hypothetical protein [Candidatus Magasanikbacteria bacterium]